MKIRFFAVHDLYIQVLQAVLFNDRSLNQATNFNGLENYGHFYLQICTITLFHITLGIPVGDRGSTVVKSLCYKSEGRWFDPIWCH